MSLQTYNPSEHKRYQFTYEALELALRELERQEVRAKSVADELENEVDFHKYTRLARTQADNRAKFERFRAAFSDLRKTEHGNPHEEGIAESLDAARRQIDALEKQIAPIQVAQDQAEEDRKAAEAEQQRLLAIQKQKSKEQEEAEQQAADLEMLGRETTTIVSDMQTVNSMTHQLDNMITDQHETVVHVDETIADAKDEMVAGNADLDVAEETQKGCCNVQ